MPRSLRGKVQPSQTVNEKGLRTLCSPVLAIALVPNEEILSTLIVRRAQNWNLRATWETRPGCDFRILPKVASSRLPSTEDAPSN
jgi:hypothetical protein